MARHFVIVTSAFGWYTNDVHDATDDVIRERITAHLKREGHTEIVINRLTRLKELDADPRIEQGEMVFNVQ